MQVSWIVTSWQHWQLETHLNPIEQQFEPRHWRFVQRLAKACAEAGGRAWLVGGCVRSAILGEAVDDFDIEVFGLSPERLEAVLSQLARPSRVGKAFGIYKLAGWRVDVGLPRRERKAGSGHCGFEIDVDPHLSIGEAAQRRDFTCNALYLDILDGSIADPLGGKKDLEARLLRHCSARFPEDPLRVLRAMQFAARIPAEVASETIELCRSLTPEGLSRERFFNEWEKLLLAGKEPSRGLLALEACDWLKYFPELHALSGCPQDPQWHPEGDVWRHTLHCMDAFARQRTGDREEDLVVGLAVLCHDMGKPATTVHEDGRIRSPGHEAAGVRPALSFMDRLNVPQRLVEQVIPLIKCHMRPGALHNAGSSAAAVRRLARDCGRMDLLMRVFRADSAGRPPMPDTSAETLHWLEEMARQLQVEREKPRPLLRGADLLERGWQSGPALGKFLEAAYEAQLDGDFSTREEAIDWLEVQLSGKS